MPTKTPIPIGPNIKRIREMRGYTQLELAHRMGYTGEDAGAVISHIENGNRTPWMETLEKIAAALGVSMGMFLLAEPEKQVQVNGKEGK